MKRWQRILGIVVALAAGAFFITYTWRALAGQDLRHLLRPQVGLAAIALVLLYSLLIPVTSLAWTWLLRGLNTHASFSITAPILATTQFGKYLPGNVAHHLGRVVIAQNHGLGLPATITSIAYETLLTVLACAHLSALTFLWMPPVELNDFPLAPYRGPLILAVSAGAIAAMLAAPHLAGLIARLRTRRLPRMELPPVHPGWWTAFGCYLLYVLNFTLVGVGLWLLSRALGATDGTNLSPILFIGAFASSWILGFLAPGAPAGLGVREAVLAMWLGGSLGPAVTAAAIVVLRLATTLGDLLSFLWGSIVFHRRRQRVTSQ